jgi:hypothetical protein
VGACFVPGFYICVFSLAGVPVPFDSCHSYLSGISLLPRDQYIITKGSYVYQYDPVMQQTSLLYNIMQLFEPPVGSTLNLGGTLACSAGQLIRTGGTVITSFDTATWWRGKSYFFTGLIYLRWKAPGAGGSSVALTNDGWMDQIDSMDGWLTASMQWSYAFRGPWVHLYNNKLDRRGGPPTLIADEFPNLPLNQSDSEVELGRASWVVWKENMMWLYQQKQKKIIPSVSLTKQASDSEG